MAVLAVGAVGAAAGWAVGGTVTAALYGAQIGFSLFGLMGGGGGGDQTVQGPKIGEVATQNSKEGIPRPIIFGVCRPIGGNIIASGKPRIKVIREKVSSGGGGGKGGGGGGGGDTYQEREEVYRTYAIRISEGPVSGVRRVWRDNKLVYDSVAQMAKNEFASGNPGPRIYGYTSAGANTQVKNNAEFLKVARVYLGGYDQMPDPALEAEFGVANVTAYRGTCYMVMDNEDLTPRRGSIPQYVFEVARGEGFPLTSRPYPVEDGPDYISTQRKVGLIDLEQTYFETIYEDGQPESIDTARLVGAIDMNNVLEVYDNDQPDYLETSRLVGYMDLDQVLKTYTNGQAESLQTNRLVGEIDLDVLLITYSDWPAESMETTRLVGDITLGAP